MLTKRTGITRDATRRVYGETRDSIKLCDLDNDVQSLLKICKCYFWTAVHGLHEAPTTFLALKFVHKKIFYLPRTGSVLNTDCTVVFYVMKRTKLNPTYIYFEDVLG